MTQTTEALIWEARARIIWGEKPDAVAAWLAENDVGSKMIDDIIRTSMKERAVEIRKRGLRELLIGAALLAGGAAGIAAIFYFGPGRGQILLLPVLAVGCGVFRFGRGVAWLIEGGNSHGSVTNLGEEF